MNIKTRHGYETPLAEDLQDYQLGWSINDGCLYIKDPNAPGAEKVLRVLSDKALADANEKFVAELQNSLNIYSDEEISKAKEELKKLYEKKTTYVIEFGVPLDDEKEEGVDYTVDAPFDYYTKDSADEAVAAFIANLKVVKDGSSLIKGQDADISNAGSKIIISKADHSVAYLYMILEDENKNEYGQLINTLEQSFPSLCLEWSENKSNTLEFKLNEEVLNSVDFSKMVIDEGMWSHDSFVRFTDERISEYVEQVSPICFYAKKSFTYRPGDIVHYDNDYTYGYTSSIKDDFVTSNDEATDNDSIEINPSKITTPITSFYKRNKYYSLFRIRHGFNDKGVPFMYSAYSSTYPKSLYCNSYMARSIVEVYNYHKKRWEMWKPFGNWSYGSLPSTSYPYGIDSNWANIYPASSWNAPTSNQPIILNCAAPNKDTILSNTGNYINFSRLYFTDIQRRLGFAEYAEKLSSSDFAVCNAFDDLISSKDTSSILIEDSSFFDTTTYKIPSSDYVLLDEGFDYVALEALDINSRAYIVPMYTDNYRKIVKNQLVDIFQIMLKPASTYLESSGVMSEISTSGATYPLFFSNKNQEVKSINPPFNAGLHLGASIFTKESDYNFIESTNARFFVNNSLQHNSDRNSTYYRFFCTGYNTNASYPGTAYQQIFNNITNSANRMLGSSYGQSYTITSYSNYLNSTRNLSTNTNSNAICSPKGAQQSMVSAQEIYGFAPNRLGLEIKELKD